MSNLESISLGAESLILDFMAVDFFSSPSVIWVFDLFEWSNFISSDRNL
jgi:hypothetical protein